MREQSLTDVELGRMRDDILARYGKMWSEKPEWTLQATARASSSARAPRAPSPSEYDDIDASFPACRYAKLKWYQPRPELLHRAS